MEKIISAENRLVESVVKGFGLLANINTDHSNEWYFKSMLQRFFMFYPSYFGKLNNKHSSLIAWNQMYKDIKKVKIHSPSNKAIYAFERNYRNTIHDMLALIEQANDDIPTYWLRLYYISVLQLMELVTEEEAKKGKDKEIKKNSFEAKRESLLNYLFKEVFLTQNASNNLDIRKSIERSIYEIVPLFENLRNSIIDLSSVEESQEEFNKLQIREIDDSIKTLINDFAVFRHTIRKEDTSKLKKEDSEKIKKKISIIQNKLSTFQKESHPIVLMPNVKIRSARPFVKMITGKEIEI